MSFTDSTSQQHAPGTAGGWFPTCAVFDCDGVLMDTESQWIKTVEQVSGQLGIERPGEIADRLTALPASRIADALARESMPAGTEEQELAEYSRRILRRLSELDAERISHGVELIPGALELVEELSAVMPVAVASNSARGILDTKLETAGYKPFLATWVSCDDVPEGKPAPDMYLEAVRRIGGEPERALTVEDSGPGAAAALAAGTRVVVLAEDPGTAPRGHYALTSFTDPGFRAQVRRWTAAAAEHLEKTPAAGEPSAAGGPTME